MRRSLGAPNHARRGTKLSAFLRIHNRERLKYLNSRASSFITFTGGMDKKKEGNKRKAKGNSFGRPITYGRRGNNCNEELRKTPPSFTIITVRAAAAAAAYIVQTWELNWEIGSTRGESLPITINFMCARCISSEFFSPPRLPRRFCCQLLNRYNSRDGFLPNPRSRTCRTKLQVCQRCIWGRKK